MPVYQWIKVYPEEPRPEGTFMAQQINSVQDLQDWIDSLTENELLGLEMSWRDIVIDGVDEEDGRWMLSLTQERLGEGVLRYQIKEPFGVYMAAARQEYKTLFSEPAEIFESRFEPYAQPPA